MNAAQIMDVLRSRAGLAERDAAGVAETIAGPTDGSGGGAGATTIALTGILHAVIERG